MATTTYRAPWQDFVTAKQQAALSPGQAVQDASGVGGFRDLSGDEAAWIQSMLSPQLTSAPSASAPAAGAPAAGAPAAGGQTAAATVTESPFLAALRQARGGAPLPTPGGHGTVSAGTGGGSIGTTPAITLSGGYGSAPTFRPAAAPAASPEVMSEAFPFLPQAVGDTIASLAEKVRTLGLADLNQQIQETFLPELKTTAAASGQVSPEGVVSGPFLENLQNLGKTAQREAGRLGLQAETIGMQEALKQRAIELQNQVEVERNRLQEMSIQVNADLERQRIALTREVEQGRLTIAQADLAFRREQATAQNTLGQQQLRLNLLELMTGRALQSAQMGIGAVQNAQQLQVQQLAALAGLGGQGTSDLQNFLRTLTPLAGQAQTSTQSGDALGDIMSVVGPLAGAAALFFCRVAAVLYGVSSPEWLAAAYWINFGWRGRTADLARWAYRRWGVAVAEAIPAHPWLGRVLRPLFDVAVRRGRIALVGE